MRDTKPANVTEAPSDWNSIDWRRARKTVENLRCRIFRAARDGNLKKVRSLQKLMMRSRANRLMSVRRVTQINKGKNTAGVDKIVVKTPRERQRMVERLSAVTPWKVHPAKRIFIPKASGKMRPLGIPVIDDRCLQAMVKNALEPFWEAQFEGCSYGFRSGRSCHDAIEKIFGHVRPSRGDKEWILDADIAGAFDNICHEFILKALGNFPARELIKQWLKAGYLEGAEFHSTKSGTPQGGIISPILMNIALHGMEDELTDKRYSKKFRRMTTLGCAKRGVVRYADDFVIMCRTQDDAEKCKGIVEEWLKPRGLQLSSEKTRIVHISDGFDFLGFNIRRYSCPNSTRTGHKLIIKPSKSSVMKLKRRLKSEWLSLKGHSPHSVVTRLNPIIRGWANYFRSSCASRTFHVLDSWMFKRQCRYVKHRHPNKPRKWTDSRYWGKLNKKREDRWVFGDKETGAYLQRFSWFPIERHVLVRGNSSPDDSSLKEYWENRRSKEMKTLKTMERHMARRQGGVCPVCGDSLLNGEELHTHHIVQRKDGGTNRIDNLRLLHYYCHQKVHARRNKPNGTHHEKST